jgi:hypothetical protein
MRQAHREDFQGMVMRVLLELTRELRTSPRVNPCSAAGGMDEPQGWAFKRFRPAFVPQGGTISRQGQGSSGMHAESALAISYSIEVGCGNLALCVVFSF